MSELSRNKTIAKNTLFLYFRMLLTMIVSLYTSRVVLQVLGVDDFGIYQTVGGVVGMLSFLNSALATGSSRFLTFELGTGNGQKLKRTFSTVLSAHILLAIGIALVAETAGLWFVYHKLIIPPERIDAAVFAYHLSIITAVIQLTQVPYNASIISHERMHIYAYASIVEAGLKLLIVYLLTIGGFDKLMLYAVLFCAVTVGMALYYRLYCIRRFSETRYKLFFDKKIMKEILAYSGWNLFANMSIALNKYGMVLVLNMFFSPAVVAARAVANQASLAAYHFITNILTASRPQIVKRYAAKDYDGSKSLLLTSTKYSYYLMLLLALPIILLAHPLIQLWLGQVPPYSVVFLQLAVVSCLFQVFDTSFYTALYAKGQIRENALISPMVGFVGFPVVYVLFVCGFSPIVVGWAGVVSYLLLAIVIKPLLIIRIANYTWDDILSVFIPCLKVTLLSVPFPIVATYCFMPEKGGMVLMIGKFATIVLVSILSVFVNCWFWGIDSGTRVKVRSYVLSKVR